MSSYGSTPLPSSAPAADEEAKPFMSTRQLVVGVAVCATLAVAGVVGLKSKPSTPELKSTTTAMMAKNDAINKAHSRMLENLPSIAKWQGSKRQEESWEKFGKPPVLKSLPREEWKSCSAYTDKEKKQLDEYSDYWMKRLAGDKPLTEHLDYMQSQYGKPKEVADKAKASHKQFGCDYYSIGLSGPFNGINDIESKEWKQLQGTKLNPPSKDYTGVTDLSGSCSLESTTEWGCDWDWDTSYTIVSSWTVTFSLESTADFDFFMDLYNCDLSVNIGGAVYFSLTAGWYEYNYNIWEGPSLSATTTKMSMDMAYSVFTFGVDFNNEVYSEYGTACCFNFWLMTIRPGFDVSVYSDEYAINLGSVVLGLSVGSSDYCLDKTPSRKLEEKLMAVTERTVKGSLVEKSAQKVLGASGSVRL